MAYNIQIDEFYITFSALSTVPFADRDAMRRILAGRRFRGVLQRAVRSATRRYRTLRKANMAVWT